MNAPKTTFFMSRSDAERMTVELDRGAYPHLADKAALVSMISPEKDPTDVLFTELLNQAEQAGYKWSEPKVDSPRWVEVLKFQFHDVDPKHCSPEWALNYVLFDNAMADQVIDLLERTADKVEVYAVHCEAGISRSAAVSKFISLYFNLQFPESYQLYNKHVFSTLVRRWNQRLYSQP